MRHQLKEEAIKIAIVCAALFVILEVAFFKSSITDTFRTALALSFLFVVPGWLLGLVYDPKIEFLERTVAGSLASAAIFIIIGYYSGIIFGLDIKYATYLIPIILIAGSVGLILTRKEHHGKI